MSAKSTDSAAKRPESSTAAKEPEALKKTKTTAKPDVYSKPATAPVSFFVSNPVQSTAAFCDDPGFVGPEGDSDSSDDQVAPASLFPTTPSLFSGSLFAPSAAPSSLFGGSIFTSKTEETKGEKAGLFVPLVQSTKRASLFDPPQPPPPKKEDNPSSAEAVPKPPSQVSPSAARK